MSWIGMLKESAHFVDYFVHYIIDSLSLLPRSFNFPKSPLAAGSLAPAAPS